MLSGRVSPRRIRGELIVPQVLFLNLHREFFAAIVEGRKRIEYRKQTAYWRARLEGKKYDTINFRNGYSPDAPEMLVEFRGIRRYGKGRSAYYAIRLGNILRILRWKRTRREG
jgi:ASC-1-like (ASCH) protein